MSVMHQHALDDYFEERIDSILKQVGGLLRQMEEWSETQAEILLRLDLLETCEPIEFMNPEDRRGY